MLWLCGVCPRNAKMVYHAEINVINYVKRFRKETHMIISTDDNPASISVRSSQQSRNRRQLSLLD